MAKMTPLAVKKLEEAFAMDCSIPEACFYADISKQTLYNWYKKDPTLQEKLDRLRNNPVLKARTAVVNGLKGNPEFSLKYLERKKKLEFSLRQELTGADGKDLPSPILNVQSNNSNPEDTKAE